MDCGRVFCVRVGRGLLQKPDARPERAGDSVRPALFNLRLFVGDKPRQFVVARVDPLLESLDTTLESLQIYAAALSDDLVAERRRFDDESRRLLALRRCHANTMGVRRQLAFRHSAKTVMVALACDS